MCMFHAVLYCTVQVGISHWAVCLGEYTKFVFFTPCQWQLVNWVFITVPQNYVCLITHFYSYAVDIENTF
jgi:hypothetical protein